MPATAVPNYPTEPALGDTVTAFPAKGIFTLSSNTQKRKRRGSCRGDCSDRIIVLATPITLS